MKRTNDNEKKPSQSTFSFKPTASFLQTRGFAPIQTDLDEDATPRPSGYTENFLEKIINQRSTESSDTPVQTKPMNRLRRPLQDKRVSVIQAKLSIGEPNDKYEQEADATASKVVQQINSPTQDKSVQREAAMEEEDELQMKPISSIQRESMEEEEELQMKSLVQRRENFGGGEVSTDLESSIQSARGSGQSLDPNLQAKMGQAMGADFSGVKVHIDSQSDQLNKSIQAKAFTTGQDVFFRQGAYAPSSRDGQELIAHELTHVVQQTGVRNAPHQLLPSSKAPSSQVQRLISETDFKRLAGDVGTKATLDNSTYNQILKILKKYPKEKKKKHLDQLENLCTSWIGQHMSQQGVNENKDLRKAQYIEALLEEVKAEKGGQKATNETPSETIKKEKDRIQDVDDKVIATERAVTQKAKTYKLVLYASVENPHLLEFNKKRLELTIESAKKEFKKPDSGMMKQQAAQWIVDQEDIKRQKASAGGQGMTDSEKLKAVKDLIAGSTKVGHTWIKLVPCDDNKQPLAEHSFGFRPLTFYNRPDLAVAGMVLYPDDSHEDDPDQMVIDYELTEKQYDKALTRAQKVLASPPDYLLTGYNCTEFAKDIVETTGKTFPKGAAMRVPADEITALLGVGWKDAYNPNALHKSIADSNQGYVPKAALDAQQKAQAAQQRAQANAIRQRREQNRGNVIAFFGDNTGKKFSLANDFNFVDKMMETNHILQKGEILVIDSVNDYHLTIYHEKMGANYYVEPLDFYEALGL
ncbi:MAG: hypothetical protein DCF20_18045 [Pseudanabaena sp.]|nr:MAG: hypothetical protein DCF20_18045 [Pseudanabaena sp.]